MESAEPVLMQRAAAPCTLRIVHCAPAPLSGRALCITDRVRKALQRSTGRILMQQHRLVQICNMAELCIAHSSCTYTTRNSISQSAKSGKKISFVKGPLIVLLVQCDCSLHSVFYTLAEYIECPVLLKVTTSTW